MDRKPCSHGGRAPHQQHSIVLNMQNATIVVKVVLTLERVKRENQLASLQRTATVFT